MLTIREPILAKIEATYNTDPTPTASADAILVESPSWSHEGARMHERPASRPSLGKLKQTYGGSLKKVSFSAEVKGSGAAYSATVRPEIDVLLRACGMGATIVTTASAETATYAPASTGHESITIYYYTDGIRHIITGARGNVDFTTDAGGRILGAFTFTGHWSVVTDTAMITPTYDTASPPNFIGASFVVGGYAAIIAKLAFGLNNAIATPPSANASDGFAEIRITGRDVMGSFDPENVLVATNPFIAQWTANATRALSTGVIGTVQYNRFTVSFPATYYKEISPGDRDGIRTLEVGFGCAESATDDEISIAFT